MNRFVLIHHQLSEDARSCLRAVCCGTSLREMVATLGGPITGHLDQLARLGLVESDLAGSWQSTWLGHGVKNWSQQVRWTDPEDVPAEPREADNGEDTGPPCNDFRLLITEGRCWCGRWREDHASEAIEVAKIARVLLQNFYQ